MKATIMESAEEASVEASDKSEKCVFNVRVSVRTPGSVRLGVGVKLGEDIRKSQGKNKQQRIHISTIDGEYKRGKE